MANQKQRLVSVWAHKGGVGKSTISLALASGLHQRGRSVAVIDIDDTARTSLDASEDDGKYLPFPVAETFVDDFEDVEFIVVDHPPHYTAETAADVLVIPTTPVRGSFAALRRQLEGLEEKMPRGNKIVVALNEISNASRDREEIADAIEAYCREKKFVCVRLRKRSAHEYAHNRGGTVYQRECVKGASSAGVREAREDMEALLMAVAKAAGVKI